MLMLLANDGNRYEMMSLKMLRFYAVGSSAD